MKVLIILAIVSIPIFLIVGTIGFIKIADKINNFLYDIAKSDKSIVLIIAMLANLNTQAQTPVTSLGFGYEYKNGAIPVQLTAGICIRGGGELALGYTVFFHREDAKIPKILFMRYGLALPAGSLEIMPLIGTGMLLATTYEKALPADPNHVYDDFEIVRNPSEFKILYGLKVQKPMGLGGLFMSVEHCKLTYANVGLYIKIN